MGDVDNEGGYARVEAGDTRGISVASLQFCCEPKTALKNKILIIKKSRHNGCHKQ